MDSKIAIELGRSFLFALPIAVGFFLLLRFKAPSWSYLLFGMLPVSLPLWLSSTLRVYGYHSFMQAGIVYEILNGHIPPHDPLFAGGHLLYPWGYAFLVAGVSRLFNISPFYSTTILSTIALAGILIVTFKISRLFTTDLAANLFATLVPLFAFTFTQDKILMPLYQWGADASHLYGFGEWRSMPILAKFNGDTGFPFGFFFFGLFLYFFLRGITAGTWNWKQAGLLILMVFGVGFTYPFFFPSAVCAGFAACMLEAYRRRQGQWRLPVLIALTLVVTSALLLFYLIPISHGKAPAARLVMNLSWPNWKRKIGVLIITCVPMWLLFGIYRRRLWETLKAHSTAAWAMAISAVVSCGLFLGMNTPFASEYKFLAQGMYVMGILGGWCFAWLRQRRPVLCFALILLFLVPMGTDVARKSFKWTDTWSYPHNYYEKGVNILKKDPAENRLYTWIRKNTDLSAVFLDASLDLTVYGQRELYVAKWSLSPFSGFGMRAQEMLGEDNGYNPVAVQEREIVLAEVLNGKKPLTLNDLAPVIKRFPKREIYIVARTEPQKMRMEHCSFLKAVFHDSAGDIFTIVRTPQPPPIGAAVMHANG